MSGYAKEWLTEKEWKQIIKAPSQKNYNKNPDRLSWRDELLLKITYYGGLRINETLDLQYPYNFRREESNGYVILVGTKTREDQEEELQPVGYDMVSSVERYMKSYHTEKETNFVFEITRQRAYDIVNEMGELAEIDKKLGTHTLRRSRAKHLYDNGWDIESVSDFLRHQSISTTRDYLKISKKTLADKMKQTDEDRGL